MYYKIYPDVIFLANLLTDYVLMSVLSRICRITTTYARLFASAGLGAAWSIVRLVLRNMPVVPELFCTYVAVPFLMIYITEGRKKIREYLIGISVFYCVAAAMSGVIELFGRRRITSFMTIVVLVLICQVAEPVIRLIKKYVKRKNLLYTVELEFHGRSIRIKGLLDTGNSLMDPYNGRPVCVADKVIFERLGCCEEKCGEGIRLIPFRSLGKKNGLMRLITLDSMVIEYDDVRQVCIKPEVALYEGRLTGTGEYEIILNAASLDYCKNGKNS